MIWLGLGPRLYDEGPGPYAHQTMERIQASDLRPEHLEQVTSGDPLEIPHGHMAHRMESVRMAYKIVLVLLISTTGFIVRIDAAPSSYVSTEDSPNHIKGQAAGLPTSENIEELEDALDALDAACPGTSEQLFNCDIAVVPLPLTPTNSTSGRMFSSRSRLIEYGTHDHDTIAINYDALSDAPLAATIWHELQHAKRAQAANAETDSTDGSFNPTKDENDEPIPFNVQAQNYMEGIATHAQLSLDDYSKMCDMMEMEMPPMTTSEDCTAQRSGVEDKKNDMESEALRISENGDEAQAEGAITQADNDDLQSAASDLLEAAETMCHDLEGMCMCPEPE